MCSKRQRAKLAPQDATLPMALFNVLSANLVNTKVLREVDCVNLVQNVDLDLSTWVAQDQIRAGVQNASVGSIGKATCATIATAAQGPVSTDQSVKETLRGIV